MQLSLLLKVLKVLLVLKALRVLLALQALQVQQVLLAQLDLQELMVRTGTTVLMALTVLTVQQQPFRLARLRLVQQVVMPQSQILEPALQQFWISAFLRVLQAVTVQMVLREQMEAMVPMAQRRQ